MIAEFAHLWREGQDFTSKKGFCVFLQTYCLLPYWQLRGEEVQVQAGVRLICFNSQDTCCLCSSGQVLFCLSLSFLFYEMGLAIQIL